MFFNFLALYNSKMTKFIGSVCSVLIWIIDCFVNTLISEVFELRIVSQYVLAHRELSANRCFVALQRRQLPVSRKVDPPMYPVQSFDRSWFSSKPPKALQGHAHLEEFHEI